MRIDKYIIIIVFALSIVFAMVYQIIFIKNAYTNAEVNVETDFIRLFQNTFLDFEQNDNTTYPQRVSTGILKQSGRFMYHFNSKDFEHEILSHKKKDSLLVPLSKNEFENFCALLEKNNLSKRNVLKYEIDYLPFSEYRNFGQININADLLLTQRSGIFSVSINNYQSYVFSKIKNVIISSFVFFIVIITSSFLLIRKYINEKKISRFKDEFINNLTHELQTPVTISSLALEKLSTELLNNQGHYRYASIAKQENSKIGNLTKRILELAELDKKSMKRSFVDIDTSVLEILDRSQLLLDEKDTFSTDFNHQNIQLNTDKEQFLDLLDNLINNAIKYSKTPRIISIKTFVKKRNVVLTIRDNGIGIPEEFRKKVFDPFFKVPTDNVHEIKSHGLGLNYVSKIVKRMNGTISLSSEVDKGTVINITLPYDN